MKRTLTLMTLGCTLMLASCNRQPGEWQYSIDEFADIEVLRYQIPDWDLLTLKQKQYIFHLSEAAKYGRDITWDQYFKYNLDIRYVLETILTNQNDKGAEWDKFVVYAKRVFFSNGIHHHYSDDKILPECSREYFAKLMEESHCYDEELLDVIFNPDTYVVKRYQGSEKDLVEASAVNFYEGVSAQEVNDFYDRMADPNDQHPITYGLNSRVVKKDGQIVEDVYKVGGLYGKALEKIITHLNFAAEVAENDLQRQYIAELIEYYKTGDLRMWDQYNITWVQDTESTVDFVNGFVEDYDDPLGRKATWEGIVNYRDAGATERTKTISANAQWFEDHAPINPEYRKKEVKGISAKVINVALIAGGNYPSTAIGINLPNADWIRKEHGSKSVTIANITDAYDRATEQRPKSILTEFAWDKEEIELCKKYGSIVDNLHTDMHECLGHASGQLREGTPANALKEFTSTLEEARADLFALYYMADPKMIELGLLDSPDAYKALYMNQIRNGIFTQFCRVELGKQNIEAHMQDRKLIAQWCYEKGKEDKVIEMKKKNGKTYFVINDFEALRGLFGELLGEIQRIKSEGDYEAGKALVETYAINIDYDLHKEVLERYSTLGLKPYRGFVNPEIIPVLDDNGEPVDFKIMYVDDFLEQQLRYGKYYRTL